VTALRVAIVNSIPESDPRGHLQMSQRLQLRGHLRWVNAGFCGFGRARV